MRDLDDLLAHLALPDLDGDADKTDRGKLLLVAGSEPLPGAALLAARAALRVGCGTVRVAAAPAIAPHLGVAQPELMVIGLERGPAGHRQLRAQLPACQAIAIGPGLERTVGLVGLLAREATRPLLVDAGALRDLPPGPGRGPRVLTPHPGELARMVGGAVKEDDRLDAARGLARRYGAVVVAKGHPTYLVAPDGEAFRAGQRTRALGAAGSGDALAGAIAGLLAQGLDALAAAAWGLTLHARAGEAVAAEQGDDGVLASEVIAHLPRVLAAFRGSRSGGSLN